MSSKWIAVMALALCVLGCRKSQLIDTNLAPVADARVINAKGKSVDEKTIEGIDGGAEMLRFDYAGEPIKITLDGSHSSDDDGHIVEYRWLSGNPKPDGGPGRFGPTPKGKSSSPKATVMLGEGTWRYTLWVTDDGGTVSAPDTVTFTIGAPPATNDPKVKQCVDNVISSVPDDCRVCVCSIDDTCRAAVVENKCDADCWGLIACIGSQCPDYAQTMDVTCVVNNCSTYLTTAAQAGAPGAGACVVQCSDRCASPGADAGT